MFYLMDFREVFAINIDGVFLKKDDLLNYSNNFLRNPKSQEWQKSIYSFIKTWLDESSYIITKTSGSTGSPKNIRIKKQQMVNSALKTGNFLKLRRGDKALLCLPASFIAGKMMLVRAMVLGLNLKTVQPSGNPLRDFDEDFHFAAMIPLQVFQILKEEYGKEKLNRIKNLIIGGGSVSDGLRYEIKKLNNSIYSTYGMTETVTHIAMERLNGYYADGLLHALPGVKINTDYRKRLIINAPEISDNDIKTNDIAIINNDTTFKIVGRYDNLIISGGVNIIPELIEEKLENYITERFIISSDRDDKLGEKLVLVVEGEDWPKEQKDNFLNKISKIVTRFELPKFIKFVLEFPQTENGKINRLKLRGRIVE